MPRSFPDSPILLKAAVHYLENELMPTLSGYQRFQTRVTINVLNTICRELELRETHSTAERQRLVAILGHDGDVDSLNRELCGRIRAGAITLVDPVLIAHLRQSLADALAINNPRWAAR